MMISLIIRQFQIMNMIKKEIKNEINQMINPNIIQNINKISYSEKKINNKMYEKSSFTRIYMIKII